MTIITNTKVLDKYPSFKYIKVNADDSNYDDLVKACGVVKSQLNGSPSVLIIEGGIGVWIHGPQTMNKLEELAREYDAKSNSSH